MCRISIKNPSLLLAFPLLQCTFFTFICNHSLYLSHTSQTSLHAWWFAVQILSYSSCSIVSIKYLVQRYRTLVRSYCANMNLPISIFSTTFTNLSLFQLQFSLSLCLSLPFALVLNIVDIRTTGFYSKSTWNRQSKQVVIQDIQRTALSHLTMVCVKRLEKHKKCGKVQLKF